MTDDTDTIHDEPEKRPLIGYVRKTGHTTVIHNALGEEQEVAEYEFLCRGCYDDGDFPEPGGEDNYVATVRDQPAFGNEITSPSCDRCDEPLLPDFEEMI